MQKFPIEPLTPDEVLSLLKALSTKSSTGLRNRALVTVLYRGGLRLAESLALYEKDLDREAGTVAVLHGKGDKARLVGLDAGAWAVIGEWLARRAKLGLNGRQPLFCTLEGNPLWASYVKGLLPRLAKKAGVTKRVHAHGLRHTHTRELAEEGVPVHLIRDQLGHSNISTTDKYLRQVAPLERVARLRNRTWGIQTEPTETPEEFSGV